MHDIATRLANVEIGAAPAIASSCPRCHNDGAQVGPVTHICPDNAAPAILESQNIPPSASFWIEEVSVCFIGPGFGRRSVRGTRVRIGFRVQVFIPAVTVFVIAVLLTAPQPSRTRIRRSG